MKKQKKLRLVEDFTSRLVVLDYDKKAAAHCGNIRAELEKSEQMIGVNDLHIAGLILVTNNLREFERVLGLRLENWVG